jgi:hypothetical protein
MALTLTREQVTEYARDKQYATMMFGDAGLDYIACRCCILNKLHSGFRLASEAIEKLLKAFIFLETGAETTLRGNDRHNPYLLKQELNGVRPDPKLDNFDDLLHKLHDHFQSRYYDNRTTGKGASSDELDQIDDLFVYLTEMLPMPDEVKYRCRFFGDLCDGDSRRYWRNYHWATESNRALQGKMESIERTYNQVLGHLYGRTETPTI